MYEGIGSEIGRLVEEKQAAYGDSFGKSGAVLRILYPNGITLEQLDDALTIVRVLDKLFRIATDRDALGESPWRDIAGYALLSVARVEKGATKPVKNEVVAAHHPEPEKCGACYVGIYSNRTFNETPCIKDKGHDGRHEDADGWWWN